MHPTFVDGSRWNKFKVRLRHVQRIGHSHTATQVTPLICQIVMSYVHQTTNFATECMFDVEILFAVR